MKSIAQLPLIIWSLLTLLAYSSVWVSPQTFKYSGLISLSIPLFIIANLGLVLFALITKPRRGLVPFILLLCAFPFLKSTLALNRHESPADNSFEVMNYNLMRMNKMNSPSSQAEMRDWLSSNSADIKCFQEFLSSKPIAEAMASNNYYSHLGGYANSFAIFSKFPIVNKGVFYEDKRTNNIIFADVKIKGDTVRIYNAHLESMSINVEGIMDQEHIEENYEEVKKKFENGSMRRAVQINDLINHIKDCRYPIVLVGDFNDTPYSYNYFKISRYFNNAFEKAGQGFGFTYNGKLPFLRIDNQFFNDKLRVHKFSTLNRVEYSDHFPVIGIYSLTH